MIHRAFRPVFAVSALLTLLALPRPALAQHAGTPAQPQTTAASSIRETGDAEELRQQLTTLLEKYPPSVGRVLKLDPTLMTNQGYLATYPALATFLAEHPDVVHNPGFYFERFDNAAFRLENDPKWQARRQFNDMVGNFAAFLVFLVVTGVLIWLIRLFVDHRRWNRLSKIQTDVHTKLLDRFSNNEDLLAYIQTPAGKRFLESAPIQVHDQSQPIGAPFSRILWSVQAGVVLALAGIGILIVSSDFVDEAGQFFTVVGGVTLALGVGFIASSAAAYFLSRRLGLLERANPDHA